MVMVSVKGKFCILLKHKKDSNIYLTIKCKISDQKFNRPLFGAKESCQGPNRVS